MNDATAAPFRPFASLTEALSGPRSDLFGIGPDGGGKRPESYYQSVDRYVSFDVSNNQILCSIAANGLLENACILKDVAPSRGVSDRLPGVFAEKELIGGGPWPFSIALERQDEVHLHEIGGVTAELLGNLFPLFSYQHRSLGVRLLAFAPSTAAPTPVPPRAIIVVVQLQNEGDTALAGVLRVASAAGELGEVVSREVEQPHYEALMCLDDTTWRPHRPEVSFALAPAENATACFAFLLGESTDELRRTGNVLREHTVLEWFNETWMNHSHRFGQLSIPDDPYYAEGVLRFRELCRQSVLRLGDGRFGGGFWGSDFAGASAWASPKIWNKDNFHAMLPMALLDPPLCRDAILFFLRWALPHAPYGPAARRFRSPRRITHSLANGLSPLILAGAYYQMTGDKSFFRAHREVLALGRDLLDDVLQSRQGGPFLFPSMYISDGEARGDYHTGSNLLVWYAFHSMARLAHEVYEQPELAGQWSEAAGKVKDAILAHCIGVGSLGARFFEGANKDGTFVACHDGEETDVALMPFYGFCEPDEPALVNHSKLGLSPENPLYAPGLDGIWWGDNHHQPAATFPGWMTALAGAATREEVGQRLEQIRRLTDHDGSIWWWPYRHPETDPTRIRRKEPWFRLDLHGRKHDVGVGKCGWAAGVYLCLFTTNILGLRVDVPAGQVALRPFCPWPEFTWTDCRLGDSRLDFAYRHHGNRIAGEIMNRSDQPFEATIELALPLAAAPHRVVVNGQQEGQAEPTQRYGRPAMRATRGLGPGEALSLQVEYRA